MTFMWMRPARSSSPGRSCAAGSPARYGRWASAPRAARQPAAAGDVIGVIVRLDHVHDAGAGLGSQLDVDVDVPARIDDDRLAAVGKQV